MPTTRLILLTLSLASITHPAPPASQKSKPAASHPDDALPKAESILDGYITATGGKKAYARLRTRIARGHVNIGGAAAQSAFETYAAEPDKIYSLVQMGDAGNVERGSDGRIAWEISPLTGARRLEGAERDFFLRDSTFNADLNWRKLTKSAETIGSDFIAGSRAWKVRVITRDGAEMTLYYDEYTNLLVRMDAAIQTPLGQVPVEVYPSDYRKVRGILVPHKSTQKMLGIIQTAIFDKIEFNKPIPKSRFTPPDSIKNLPANDKPAGPNHH